MWTQYSVILDWTLAKHNKVYYSEHIVACLVDSVMTSVSRQEGRIEESVEKKRHLKKRRPTRKLTTEKKTSSLYA